MLRILRDRWWLGDLKIDQNSSVRELYVHSRQDEELERVGELHQFGRGGNEIQGEQGREAAWEMFGISVRVVFMCSRLEAGAGNQRGNFRVSGVHDSFEKILKYR